MSPDDDELRVTPPSVGDVLLVGRALGWPAMHGEGIAIARGETHWRAAVTPATTLDAWEALQDLEPVEAPEGLDAGEPPGPGLNFTHDEAPGGVGVGGEAAAAEEGA